MVLVFFMVSNRMFVCIDFWNDIFYVELMEYLNFKKIIYMGYIIYNKDFRGNSSFLYLLLFIYVGNICKRIYRWFFF